LGPAEDLPGIVRGFGSQHVGVSSDMTSGWNLMSAASVSRASWIGESWGGGIGPGRGDGVLGWYEGLRQGSWQGERVVLLYGGGADLGWFCWGVLGKGRL
jgi:hypothetical protein